MPVNKSPRAWPRPIVSLLGLLLVSSASAQLRAPVPAVDVTNHTQVLALYRDCYLAPIPAPNWTGNFPARDPGMVGDDFLRATLQRINYYRAMSGLRGDVTFDPKLDDACQQAALMVALARHISHQPPPSWKGYTPTAALAAANSELCMNWSPDLGPGAVDRYIAEDEGNNASVGHRRWLLYPPASVMGAGVVPAAPGVHPGGNAVWARPTAAAFTAFGAGIGPDAAVTTAWPPAGYVPAPLVYARWSFSCANADFRGAAVRVMKNSRSLPVALEPLAFQTDAHGRGTALGLNTLVWTLPGNVVRRTADETYQVRVRNVRINGQPREFVYSVVSINPAG